MLKKMLPTNIKDVAFFFKTRVVKDKGGIMKFAKGLIGLLAFVTCLWVVVVAFYTSQSKNWGATSSDGVPVPMDGAPCPPPPPPPE
jgi:hypothetical protein